MSSRSNTKRRDSTTPEQYFSGSFHGLKFFDTFEDNTDIDKPLGCIPNITLLESNTKAIFDFTHCSYQNQFDQTTVVLNGISLGDGVTLTNGIYFDENTEERSDLSGFYTVSGIYDKTLVLTVGSVSSAETYDKTYKSLNFEEEFALSIAPSGISTSSKNIIKNYITFNPEESFVVSEIRINDKIKILNGSNANKFLTVKNIFVDENDHELIEITGGSLIEENRFNQETLINLYRADEIQGTTPGVFVENTKTQVNVITPVVNENTSYLSPILNTDIGKYFFTDIQNGRILTPIISLGAGIPYIFNALGISQHFSISTTPDGTHSGGVEFPGLVRFHHLLLFYPTNKDTFYYYDKNIRNAGGVIEVTSPLSATSFFFGTNYESAPQVPGTDTVNQFIYNARNTQFSDIGVPLSAVLSNNTGSNIGNSNTSSY